MKNNPKSFHSGRAIFSLMILICCILIGAVLKIAASVILPFTISILLAFVMYPLVKWLDKLKFPRFASILLIVIFMVTILYILGMVIYTSGKTIFSFYPKYEERLTEIYIWIARFFDLSYDESQTFFENMWNQLGVRTFIRSSTGSVANVSLKFVQNAVLTIIFMIFILLEASYFKEKLDVAFEKRSERINQMGHDLMNQVTRYLAAKFFMSLLNGIVFVIAFSLVGLEFAVVWGVIQFFLNFIPTLGSIAAGMGISLFAIVQFWPNPAPIIIVIAIVLISNIILGNVIDPKIIGDHVGISPLMILLSLAIWGYLWGFAGMVIAVPMTVIIRIVCDNIPILEPVSTLIGSQKSVNAKKAENERIETAI